MIILNRPISANKNKFTIHYSELSSLQKGVITERRSNEDISSNNGEIILKNADVQLKNINLFNKNYKKLSRPLTSRMKILNLLKAESATIVKLKLKLENRSYKEDSSKFEINSKHGFNE